MKHTGKLEFAGFVEWDMFQCVRRERIHPFRRANVFIRGILNGKCWISPTVLPDHFLLNEPRMFTGVSERINCIV